MELPEGLESLRFGRQYNRSLKKVQLPAGYPSCNQFGADTIWLTTTNIMLGPPSFARGLRTLIFGYGFNQILDEVKFPEALQTLTFGDGFKKSASISGDAVLLLFGYVWIVLLYLKKYVRETPMSPGKRSKAIVLHTISHYVT